MNQTTHSLRSDTVEGGCRTYSQLHIAEYLMVVGPVIPTGHLPLFALCPPKESNPSRANHLKMHEKPHHPFNEIQPQGLLFLPTSSPNVHPDAFSMQATGATAAFNASPSQSSAPSDMVPISSSDRDIAASSLVLNGGDAAIFGTLPSSVNHHDHDSSHLPVPRWNSHEGNQWPNRLFTTAPPSPTGGTCLPLATFRVPLGQDSLDETQNPSQSLPLDPLNVFLIKLTPVNEIIYHNCRGNRPNLWPDIAEEIYNLQQEYGDLIVPFLAGGSQNTKDAKYRCGICLHSGIANPPHTTEKRRWDCSPDILSHGPRRIKPWFSPCGKGFPRDRDQRRHATKCKGCKRIQEGSLPPTIPTPSPSLSPIPPFPLENTTPQELVIPRSSSNNHTAGGYHTHVAEPTTFVPLHNWHQTQATHSPSAGLQRTNPPPRHPPTFYPHPYRGHQPHRHGRVHPANNAHEHPYVHPNAYPMGMPMSPFSSTMQSPGGGRGTSLNLISPHGADPILPQYNQPVHHQGGHAKQYDHDQVRFCTPLPELPSEKQSTKDVLARRGAITFSHRFTAATLILLGMSALFWFILRFFIYT